MGRAPCCDKANVKKGPWSPEEDAKLKQHIQEYGTGGNWIALPQKAGLRRCGKSCRLRWLNYLRPNIKHGDFTEEEDAIICSLFAKIGSRWSIMAAQLPGRTDNDIKNYWNTKLKRKILGRSSPQRKPSSSSFDPFRFLNQKTFFPDPNSLVSEDTLLRGHSSLIVFGRDQSSSSSGGNSGKFSHGRGAEYELGYQGDQQKLFPCSGSPERESEIWGEAQLDYTLEEIRQLITGGSACAMNGGDSARGRGLVS